MIVHSHDHNALPSRPGSDPKPRALRGAALRRPLGALQGAAEAPSLRGTRGGVL